MLPCLRRMAGHIGYNELLSFPPIISFQEDPQVILSAGMESKTTTQQILSPMTPKKPKKKKESTSPRSEKVERSSYALVESALVPSKDMRQVMLQHPPTQAPILSNILLSGVRLFQTTLLILLVNSFMRSCFANCCFKCTNAMCALFACIG